MSVKTVNKTKSAFVLMLFQPDFFVNYQLSQRPTDPDDEAANEYDNKCKLSFKSCLHAFRNMRQVGAELEFFIVLIQFPVLL